MQRPKMERNKEQKIYIDSLRIGILHAFTENVTA